ncbi:DUF3570 domain-containing protein [Piscinibacter sp.]|uniref:DUF3570 domain-containing protein n=1 Tax=Piscinibacter sp. TaxID=1903157 RepID=UPI002C07C504|nr:DUF3570 domain-containing protein [Albitalea sp.]HUG23548.1 DUF3570 domain-containing protein [Albitalea sp.]
MAATSLWRRVAGLLGGMLAASGARAVDVPVDQAEAMVHVYQGGGVTASGPALLVRKGLAERVSLSGSYYIDAVSNASIDVVTTASPFKEKRTEYGLGVDYAVRDALITLSTSASREPDYDSGSVSLDVSQETFGGMTTVALGYTRGADEVRKKDDPGFAEDVTRWQYRLGITQILTPRWLASANFEIVSEDGFLGSPYRAARVFGAAVPERNPSTRSSRSLKLRVIGDVGSGARTAVRGEYRYFWDTWDIRAHTTEFGVSRYFGDAWLADAFLRLYSQSAALFYSDNAPGETTFVSRNRQLSTFNSVGLGAKVSYTFKQVPGQYELKAHGSYELVQFKFKDFTDIRTGSPYAFNANVLQLFVSASF